MLTITGSRELNRQGNAKNVELIIRVFLNVRLLKDVKYSIISSF